MNPPNALNSLHTAAVPTLKARTTEVPLGVPIPSRCSGAIARSYDADTWQLLASVAVTVIGKASYTVGVPANAPLVNVTPEGSAPVSDIVTGAAPLVSVSV